MPPNPRFLRIQSSGGGNACPIKAKHLTAEGLNPDEIAAYALGKVVTDQAAKARYSEIKSAGHGVGLVTSVQSAAAICDQLIAEYDAAKTEVRERFT